MNRTAYIARLSDSDLLDELNLYRAELQDHTADLAGWAGYSFYLLLVAAYQERQEARAARIIAQRAA